jgi:hypothetical protein
VLACGFAASLAAGCRETAERLEDRLREEVRRQVDALQPTEPIGVTPATVELAEEEQLGRKLELYIDCTKLSRERVRNSYRRYRDLVREDGTPRPGARPAIPAIAEPVVSLCMRAVEHGPRMPPELPELEDAQARYTSAVREFAELSRELAEYYAGEHYARDGWAKSKAMAPRLDAVFRAYERLGAELEAHLGPRRNEADAALLRLLEKRTGRTTEYRSRAYVVAARSLLRCLETDDATAAACAEPYAALERAKDEFDTHDERDDAVFWMSSFAASVDAFSAEAEKVLRALRSGSLESRDRARIARAYERLERDLAMLRFDFPS